jgi:hypothetical protein
MRNLSDQPQFCGKETRVSTRRDFLEKSGLGFGLLAAGYLLNRDGASAAAMGADSSNPFAPKTPHFPAKAKNVIFLLMGIRLTQVTPISCGLGIFLGSVTG